ncbi:hypothetical protein EAb13_CDS0009 [Acinetobacter phage EAb13]|nr:hypothetical protein EAb13_CDS0009 [Acinetobacter phage EAb13]
MFLHFHRHFLGHFFKIPLFFKHVTFSDNKCNFFFFV